MFTPQQIEQISFRRATFGGYDMEAVDEFLEPLTEDYITLYKENALLKSKMKVLVSKLEEYRKNEASMKDAIVNAQKTCDMMVKEAEAKYTQLLTDANAAAAENARNALSQPPFCKAKHTTWPGHSDAPISGSDSEASDTKKGLCRIHPGVGCSLA